MTTMVYKVAQIINPTAFEDDIPGHRDGGYSGRAEAIARARAIFAVIREPTEWMLIAASNANAQTGDAEKDRLVEYQAMIDAALKEPPL